MLKLSRNLSNFFPSSNSPSGMAALDLLRFASFSFSTSISTQERTPTHRLTRATFSCANTEEKNSAWRSEGVGGVRGRAEVTTRVGEGVEVYVRRMRWALGGDRRTRM